MLSPAEVSGLAGLRLASRVQRALDRIPPARMLELTREMHAVATARHLIYLHEGELETIRVLPCPLVIRSDQRSYIHYVSVVILNCLKRLPEIYFANSAAHEVLRLSEGEERWLRGCWGPSLSEHNPIFGRLDAMVDFTSPMWKETLKFVEPNLSGIGGLHLSPTADRVLVDVLLPALRAEDPELDLQLGSDIRDLLMQEILDHLEAIGRAGQQICFIDPKFEQEGPDEPEALARYLRDRHGLTIMHADPAELRVRDGEVWVEDQRVDIGYRDYEVRDLVDLEAEGADVEPMRLLFRENRMISSIAAELDQKSCWEVLTDPELSRRYFSAEERRVIRRHVLWTRILSDRATTIPTGESEDLLGYARRERESLVLKPNRSYGGEGVLVGPSVTQPEWEAALDRALAEEDDRWVVQQVASIPAREFLLAGPDGRMHAEPFYTVMGFAPSRDGVAVVGRASQKQVVNVAQHGGQCVVLVGHHPEG